MVSGSVRGSGTSSADATASRTAAGSPTGASSTRYPPPASISAEARATSSASRVLPTPPGSDEREQALPGRESRELAELPVAPHERGERFGDRGTADGSRLPRPRRGRLQRRVLLQDRRLQPAQIRSGIESELLGQDVPALLVHTQCVRLPAGPVQGDHELTAEALAEWVRHDQRLELADPLVEAAGHELQLDALLDRREPQLAHPGDRRLCELLVHEVDQGVAAPERFGLRVQRDGELGSGLGRHPGLAHQGLEAVEVHRVRGQVEQRSRPRA